MNENDAGLTSAMTWSCRCCRRTAQRTSASGRAVNNFYRYVTRRRIDKSIRMHSCRCANSLYLYTITVCGGRPTQQWRLAVKTVWSVGLQTDNRSLFDVERCSSIQFTTRCQMTASDGSAHRQRASSTPMPILSLSTFLSLSLYEARGWRLKPGFHAIRCTACTQRMHTATLK